MSFKDVEKQLDYFRYSRDEVHGYSKAVGELLDLSIYYVPDAEKAFAEGREAIWSGINGWEIPLIYANGIIPVSFSEMGRFAGVEAITIAEDHYQFPQETCSMVKCVVGEWHFRKDQAASIKRVLGSSVACEPYNMAWEIIKKDGYEVYNIDVMYRAPGVEGERLDQLVGFFIEQIHGVQAWLTGSRAINEPKLKVEIERKNRLLTKVRRILDLRLKHPFYIRSLPKYPAAWFKAVATLPPQPVAACRMGTVRGSALIVPTAPPREHTYRGRSTNLLIVIPPIGYS